MKTSFYSAEELKRLGLKRYGHNVLISRFARIYNAECIEIGDHVRIDDFSIISGGTGVRLGNFIHIAAYVAIYGGGGVVMDDFTTLSGHVAVYSESDDYSGATLTNPMVPRSFRSCLKTEPVHIAKHCIVGCRSTILPGVTLAEGVAVGAHSLVTQNCEAWKIYFGCPARMGKDRLKELLASEQMLVASLQES